MELKDLAGLSEPATKLVEEVSKGIGTIYKPRAIRKEADAEAYRIEKLAEAEAKKILIEGEAQIDLLERAKRRLVHQELIRQENIENIAEKAFIYLEENVSAQSLDEDWRTRFFRNAQEITSEEMQDVWARILAGEVSNPGTYNLRTLEVLNNLSKADAHIFEKACALASDGLRIWKIGKSSHLKEFGLSYDDMLALRDSGLLHDGDSINIEFSTISIESSEFAVTVFPIGDKKYVIANPKHPNAAIFSFKSIAFTQAGVELLSIAGSKIAPDYKAALLEDMKSEGFEILFEFKP